MNGSTEKTDRGLEEGEQGGRIGLVVWAAVCVGGKDGLIFFTLLAGWCVALIYA